MQQISDWIHADNAFWLGAVRVAKDADTRKDPNDGWRVGAMEMLHPSTDTDHRTRAGAKDTQSSEPGMSTRAIISQAGQFRVHNLHSLHESGLLDLDVFKKTRQYDYFYRKPGISDRIWAVFPINEDAESYLCFDAYHVSRRFSTVELELVGQALRGIKWFHRQLLLSHGLYVGDGALTDRERQVLRGLLSGSTEREIAGQLHLAPGTIHQYAVRIYRKFEVGSRAGLMSLWLNGCLR